MKVLVALLTIMATLSVFSPVVLAADFCDTAEGRVTEYCQDVAATKTGDRQIVGPDGIITNLTEAFSFFVGALSVIVIIIAGLRLTLGGSNPESVSKARNTIIYAIAGVVIAASAQLIVIFVLDRL